jgi:general stress protein CsbA
VKKQHPLVSILILMGLWLLISALVWGFLSGALITLLMSPIAMSLVVGAVLTTVVLLLASQRKGAE